MVIGTAGAGDAPVEVRAFRVGADGSGRVVGDAVQEESELSLFVNGAHCAPVWCSASHLVELVVGRLLTHGIVECLDDIELLKVDEAMHRIDVTLRQRGSAMAFPRRTSNGPLPQLAGALWSARRVFALAHEFELDKTSHARTRGVHSAYLAPLAGRSDNAGTLVVREDIGRHNAFDKVVGWACMNKVDLSACMLFTSGRVPADMVMKAIRSGIPVLVSKAVATNKTVNIARESGLALICAATSSSFDVMSDPLGCAASFVRENTAFA